MKPKQLLLLLVLHSPFSVQGRGAEFSQPKAVIPLSSARRSANPPSSAASNISKMLMEKVPRGGATRSEAVSQVASILAVGNGIRYLVFSEQIERMYDGNVVAEELGSLPRFVHRTVGAITLGQGISLHMALVRKSSPLTAIGACLLPRLLLSYYYILKRERLSFVSNFLKLNTALMTWVCLSVSTGIGNPSLAAKVFAAFAVLKGSLLALAPVAGTKRFFEQDISNKQIVERVHFQALGENLTYTAIYMAALAYGVAPIKAAGAALAVFAGLTAIFHFVMNRGYRDLQPNPAADIVYLVGGLLLSVGFLLPVY